MDELVVVVGALPGLWFFGLDQSIYGNMHIHRRQARQLARAISSQSEPSRP